MKKQSIGSIASNTSTVAQNIGNLAINTSTVEHLKRKLFSAGFVSSRLLAISTPMEVSNKAQIKLSDAEVISEWACQKLEQSGAISESLSSAHDFYNNKKQQIKLSTGSKSLDNMLGGGIETGAMTEFYGGSGARKTQLCYTLCVKVQQPATSGGLSGKAIYMDTENKFSAQRIIEIAEARQLDSAGILKNIMIAQPINSLQQESTIEKIASVAEKDNSIKLVIVD